MQVDILPLHKAKETITFNKYMKELSNFKINKTHTNIINWKGGELWARWFVSSLSTCLTTTKWVVLVAASMS